MIFSTVFIEKVPQNADHQVCVGILDDVDLSLGVVAGLLSGLNSSSAAGPDDLHPHMLKICSDALSLPLYLLFVRSLRKGELPTLWKSSIVTPLFKSGNRCDPLNYRPVNFTSVCCKVLEKVIVAQLVEYLELNNLLSANQFGFRKGKSVEDQLLVTYADIADSVYTGLVVDVIFLDFSKAYDVVSHSTILEKCKSWVLVAICLFGYLNF